MRSFPGSEISWWLLRGSPNFYSDPSGVGGFLFSIRKILFRGVGYALSYLSWEPRLEPPLFGHALRPNSFLGRGRRPTGTKRCRQKASRKRCHAPSTKRTNLANSQSM